MPKEKKLQLLNNIILIIFLCPFFYCRGCIYPGNSSVKAGSREFAFFRLENELGRVTKWHTQT